MRDTHELLREYMIKPKGMFIWRDIPDWEGRYQISNHGEVCSVWNKEISENDTQVILIRIDKSRHNVSRNRLLKNYWHKDDQFKGDERWKKLDHYGDYYISNYAGVKNCRRLILCPNRGAVWLYKDGSNGKRKSVRIPVLKLFLNTFPPYEIEINEENKTVNYKKKDDFITTSIARTA